MTYLSYAEGSKSRGMKANDSKLGAQLLQKSGDSTYLQKYVGVSCITSDDVVSGLTLKQDNGVFDFENEEAES